MLSTPRSSGYATTEESLAMLIASLGTDSFLDEFARQCIMLSRADQVTMFALEGGRVRHILAHRPGQDELVATLCGHYLESFASRDQLLATRLQRGTESYAIVIVRTGDIADAAYRTRLFTSAGLAGKISLLSPNAGRYLYLNFYYRDFTSDAYITGSECLGRVGRPMIELLHKHATLTGGLVRDGSSRKRIERYLGERMPELSRREAQVCAGILCGKRLADMSRELGLSPATVKTFRSRAYGKLSIHGQSGLFALCAGLLPLPAVAPKDDRRAQCAPRAVEPQ